MNYLRSRTTLYILAVVLLVVLLGPYFGVYVFWNAPEPVMSQPEQVKRPSGPQGPASTGPAKRTQPWATRQDLKVTPSPASKREDKLSDIENLLK